MRSALARWVRRRTRASRASRALAAKLVAILTGVGLIGAVFLIAVLSSVIIPSFKSLEGKSIQVEMDRTRTALEAVSRTVELKARDFAEDAAFAPNRAQARHIFDDRQVDGIAWLGGAENETPDGNGSVQWRSGDGRAIQRAFADAIRPLPLDRVVGVNRSAHFYLRLGKAVAAVGVVRISGKDSRTPPHFVLLARRLSPTLLSEASHLPTRVDLDSTADGATTEATRTAMHIVVPIRGPDGQAVAGAAFTVRREFAVLGQRMLLLAVAGSVVLLLLLLLAVRWLITTQVLRPLARVERHMKTVQRSGTLALLPGPMSADEIGSLATSFNAMLRQLHDLRQQLESQNFALGKSESATAMLHNVRNALTPVSTILSRASTQTAPVDLALLNRAVAELANDTVAPARREKLAAFVATAVAAEVQDRTDRHRALLVAREAMGQVLEIIGQQQRAVHERPEMSPCDVTDIIARNATIARYSGSVSIAVGFPAQPCHVLASRIILSQVIGNLFANAADAIAAHGTGSGSIRVTIEQTGDMAQIVIRDDGEGFAAGAAPNLFQRGYSTRQHKVGGLGLHWCANAMQAMQGTLRLDSAGPGQGAVATLSLRLAPDESDAV
jgi:two-component system OmpR family sensor kinase